jgi:hypothetical protein
MSSTDLRTNLSNGLAGIWWYDGSVIPRGDVQPVQRPILQMLQDLFDTENMHSFTGFDHQDKRQYRLFINNLCQELVGTDLERGGKIHSQVTRDPEYRTWKRLVPKRLDIPFVRESRDSTPSRKQSYLTVTVDTETHAVHAGIVFNVREIESDREYVADNVEELADYASENNMELWVSMNSFNTWNSGIPSTAAPDEMRQRLEGGSSNLVRIGDTEYKKAIFVHHCTAPDPAGLIEETKQQLLNVYEDFLSSDDLYPYPTLDENA